MITAKYKAMYLLNFNSYVRSADRWLEGLIVMTSSGGVGGWLMWQEIPWLWAVIIGSAQVVKLLKPLLPFIKDKEKLAEAYVFYEKLHLDYEKAWSNWQETRDQASAKRAYFDLREKEVKELANTQHLKVPEYRSIRYRTERTWKKFLSQHYAIQS